MNKYFHDRFPPFLSIAFKLFLLEFFLLNLFRCIFYFSFKTLDITEIPFAIVGKAFLMGLEFDLVATSYAMFLPTFLLIISDFFYHKTKAFYRISFIATLIIFWIYAFISAADLPYFHQFNSHLNKQAFLWAASPSFVLKLVFGNFSYYGYLLLFLLVAAFIFKVVAKIFYPNSLTNVNVKGPKETFIATIIIIPFLVVGARGRLSGKSTAHEGMAIVCDNLFVNQIALNPNFTFFRSVFFQKIKKYKVPNDINNSLAYARNYLGIHEPFSQSIKREQKADSAFKPYNVVIVCMESLSAYKTGIHGRDNLTPSLNNIIKQSLYFDRFFSSGIHTFSGLFATVSGYPSLLLDHALRRYTKKPFSTLGNLLLQKNYETFLAVTHDPVFDNMEGFFRLNGFNQTVSSSDFPSSKVISVTGVPDHELYQLMIKKLNALNNKIPFFAFIMSGSDHGPWAIPKDIPFKPNANTEEKRSTQYADWAIGQFIENAKKQAWFSNTLFVFLGDHGYWIDGTYEMPLSYHHIPFVLYKPNTLKPDTCHHLGYQPDVLSTVAGLLNLSFENNSFGLNIIKEKHPFVYFTADDKIGCVSDDGYYFYELLTQKTKRLRKYWKLDQENYYSEQKQKADSLEQGAKHMMNAAEFFIRRDYFSY